MMKTRRDFLKDVGAGVVAAGVGSTLAADLGFSTAFAQQGAERLTFGVCFRVMCAMPWRFPANGLTWNAAYQ